MSFRQITSKCDIIKYQESVTECVLISNVARVRATLTQRWYLQLTLDTGLGKSKYCTVSLFCSEDTQTNLSVAIAATCGGGEAAKYQPSHPATHFSRWNTLSGGFCCCWLSETQPQPGHQCSLWQPRASLNWICIYISTIVGYTPHSRLGHSSCVPSIVTTFPNMPTAGQNKLEIGDYQ